VDPHVIDVGHQKTKKLGPRKTIGYPRKNTNVLNGVDSLSLFLLINTTKPCK